MRLVRKILLEHPDEAIAKFIIPNTKGKTVLSLMRKAVEKAGLKTGKHYGFDADGIIETDKGKVEYSIKNNSVIVYKMNNEADAYIQKIVRIIKQMLNENKGILLEKMTRSDLDVVERFADALFKELNIDIVFTRHFFDRLNDMRNQTDIEATELADMFKKFFNRYKAQIVLFPLGRDGIIKDIQSKLNLPFVMEYDKETDMIDFKAKTIMRKDNFLGNNKKFVV